jgi:peptidoglycan hydrolase-like protein with peptidoglycan-binding domain
MRHRRRLATVSAGAVVVGLGSALALAACGPTPGNLAATTVAAHGGSPAARTAAGPARPLRLTGVTPAGRLTGAEPIVVGFSAPVAAASPHPTIRPAVAGTWSATGSTFAFTPAAGYDPLTSYRVTVPAGIRAADGGRLATGTTRTLPTPAGSLLRAQQILARLGYLPLTTTAPVPGSAAAELAAAYAPSAAPFSWRYPSTPALLRAQWAPGRYTVMTKGAVMAFQDQTGLAVDGVLGPATWRALLAADLADRVDPQPYSYIAADLNLPQTLTVWRAGSVVLTSPVNGGVPAAPTPLGTFPIYERLTSTTMSGRNPDGSHYRDPGVPWVNYFSGGSAVHGFPRAAYGFPQSVGCLELPIPTAQRVFGMVGYGTLVSVYGAA